MNTHSLVLMVKVDYEFDPTQVDKTKALRRAISSAFKPDTKSIVDGVKVLTVTAHDPEAPSISRRWGAY